MIFSRHRVGGIASVQTGPFGSQLHAKDYKLIGTPIITVEHLGENRIIHNELPLVSDQDRLRLSKYSLKEGDIVFSRVGSVDRRAYVSKKENGWLFSGRCLRIRVESKDICPKYLSYYFGLQSFKQYIRQIAVGATMPSLNTQILSDIIFEAPDLITQTSIASILSSLDHKIELNRRMNQTLEQMAQALFNHYFIDAVDETALNEVGLLDITTLWGGGTPKTSIVEYWDGTVSWISAKDVTPNNGTFILETERRITAQGLKNSSAKLLPAFSTVITARGTVGNVCLLPSEMAISQSNYALKSKAGCEFVLFQVIQQKLDELKRNSYGTVFDTITTNTIRDIKVLVPDLSSVNKLEDMLKPLYKKMLNNLKENNSLSKIRDTLLPKLMSGEINVDELMNEELIAEQCHAPEIA